MRRSLRPSLPVAPRAGVSVAIFSVFTCTRLESGVSYLDADARIVCWDATHRRYVGGAIVWLLIVPVGVPAFFTWLLRRFRVPQMARLLEENAWLRAAIALAWREGVAQPPGAASLAVDTIPTRHLEALYAFFLRGRSAEEASDILLGSAPPVEEEEDEARHNTRASTVAARVSGALRAASSRVARLARKSFSRRRAGAGKAAGADDDDDVGEQVARRKALLQKLLLWCRTSNNLAIPVIVWDAAEDEPDGDDDADAGKPAAASPADAAAAAAAATAPVRTAEVPQLLERAYHECGCVLWRACVHAAEQLLWAWRG